MAKQKITVVRGTTNTFVVTVVDEDGDPYVLGTGELFRFGVKKNYDDAEYLIEVEMDTPDNDGEYEFVVYRDDTEDLDYGTYYYDIGLQAGSDYFSVVPASPFVIAPNVTAWEE